MTHLEKFSFLWVENDLELSYSVNVLTDKKKLVKKLTMGRETKKIWSFTTDTIDVTKFRGKIFRYFWFVDLIETYFGVSSANPYKDLTPITIGQKITL